MNSLIITRFRGCVLTAQTAGRRLFSLRLDPEEEQSLLGNIYVGRVLHVVKNIEAAFVDLGGGLTGYYSLRENKNHLFTGGPGPVDPAAARMTPPHPLRQGDEILVQISRDAVKTKEPSLSPYLNFTGRFAVLTLGKTQIGFSSRIRDAAWKESVLSLLKKEKTDDFGIIVRTNAYGASPEQLADEIRSLKSQMERVLSHAQNRVCPSLLAAADPPFLQGLRDAYADSADEILTDIPAWHEPLRQCLALWQPEALEKLRLYEDPLLSLSALFGLEAAVGEVLSRRVWLKSGGYLVIDPTEALTVIDVNSGKYAGKKTAQETILRMNLEAAAEAARQIRLRNLSGIILIDFIDMEREEQKAKLLETLRACLAKDPIRTTFVDLTKLGLAEITRRKLRPPIYEVLRRHGAGEQDGGSKEKAFKGEMNHD